MGVYMTWSYLCRFDPGVIYFQRPDLVQPLQAGSWRRFGLFGWVYMTWLRLCRLSPGVITFHYVTFTGLWPLGASVVTVDVDVDVVVGEFAGVVENKLCVWEHKFHVLSLRKI